MLLTTNLTIYGACVCCGKPMTAHGLSGMVQHHTQGHICTKCFYERVSRTRLNRLLDMDSLWNVRYHIFKSIYEGERLDLCRKHEQPIYTLGLSAREEPIRNMLDECVNNERISSFKSLYDCSKCKYYEETKCVHRSRKRPQ